MLFSTPGPGIHAPSLWWLRLLPGPSQSPLLGSLLSAGQEAKKESWRERKYQVPHILKLLLNICFLRDSQYSFECLPYLALPQQQQVFQPILQFLPLE